MTAISPASSRASASRWSRAAIRSPSPAIRRAVDQARQVLSQLYQRLKRGLDVDLAARSMPRSASRSRHERTEPEPVRQRRRAPSAPSAATSPRAAPTQAQYLRALQEHELVFGIGPAGTGKTYLAVAVAVAHADQGRGRPHRAVAARRSRRASGWASCPAICARRSIPICGPLYDALHDMMPAEQVLRRLSSGEIEIAPLAFMRGRTLTHGFVILDEAQNTTPVQMKMFLTRLGEKSRMAVTGDLSQIDLPLGQRSGLQDAVDTLDWRRGHRRSCASPMPISCAIRWWAASCAPMRRATPSRSPDRRLSPWRCHARPGPSHYGSRRPPGAARCPAPPSWRAARLLRR